MMKEGTRAITSEGQRGIVEVASEDDQAYHVRLDEGHVIQVHALCVGELQQEVCSECDGTFDYLDGDYFPDRGDEDGAYVFVCRSCILSWQTDDYIAPRTTDDVPF